MFRELEDVVIEEMLKEDPLRISLLRGEFTLEARKSRRQGESSWSTKISGFIPSSAAQWQVHDGVKMKYDWRVLGAQGSWEWGNYSFKIAYRAVVDEL